MPKNNVKNNAIDRAFAAGLLLTQACPVELKGLAAEVCKALDPHINKKNAETQYEDIQAAILERQG